MNDQEINIAIAEACGWREIETIGQRRPWGFPPVLHNPPQRVFVPSYTADLNAVHEACETAFGGSNAWTYFIDHLCELTQAINCSMYDALVITNRATARQWAEAFLRTIGKWKEGA